MTQPDGWPVIAQGTPAGRSIRRQDVDGFCSSVLFSFIQDLSVKLTALQEQATTDDKNIQTSEEVAQAHEHKNKVKIRKMF